MSNALHTALLALVPMVVPRLLDILLQTPVGHGVAARLGGPGLASERGREIVKRYAKSGSAALVTALIGGKAAAQPAPRFRTDWAYVVDNLADLLLGTGAALKVVAGFLREREEVNQAEGNR